MSSRRGGHKDLLHDAIGNVFREEGWDTLDLKGMGAGVPDWFVAKGAMGFLVEVKTPRSMSNRTTGLDERGLNEKQQAFHAKWKSLIYVVESVAEVWELLGKHHGGLAGEQRA